MSFKATKKDRITKSESNNDENKNTTNNNESSSKTRSSERRSPIRLENTKRKCFSELMKNDNTQQILHHNRQSTTAVAFGEESAKQNQAKTEPKINDLTQQITIDPFLDTTVKTNDVKLDNANDTNTPKELTTLKQSSEDVVDSSESTKVIESVESQQKIVCENL